jgi:hypothetical protein
VGNRPVLLFAAPLPWADGRADSTLLRSLRNDPDARGALLRELLSDRFLDLPARVDAIEQTLQQLVEAQVRTQQQLDVLT